MFNLKSNNSDNDDNDSNDDKKTMKDKKSYTQDEINLLIKNTIIIPEDKWMNLEPGVFISYIKKDGTFVKGGYIQVVNQSKAKRKYFRIVFNQNSNSKGYTLYLDQIQTLYKKINETSYYELNAIRESYDKIINKLEDKINNLENLLLNKIEKNKENNNKILKLIKKLHKNE